MKAGFCVFARVKDDVDAKMEEALASRKVKDEISKGELTPSLLEQRVMTKLKPKRVSAFFSFPAPASSFIELAEAEPSIIEPTLMYCSGKTGEKPIPYTFNEGAIALAADVSVSKKKIKK